MDAQATAWIPRAFETMPDPRRHNIRHKFLDIITIALFAVLCGCDDWCSVATYGRTKRDWLATFLELPNGIPSHDTFSEVFARLNPDAFEACFRIWMASMVELSGGKLVAIDGNPGAPGHWQLDVSFDEDHRRIRKGHGAENFSRLCRLSLNLLKRETSQKIGMATKRKICGWDNDYLLKVATS